MTVENLTTQDYTHFQVERQHFRNAGTIALPVYAVPEADSEVPPTAAEQAAYTPCRIVRLHAPIEAMIISWTAVKEGTPPEVPNPYLFDTNLTFKCGKRSAALPVQLPGYEGHAWSMAGVYEYHMTKPTNLHSDMPLGKHPWDQSIVVSDAIIPNQNFISSILEGSEGEAWQENENNPVVEG